MEANPFFPAHGGIRLSELAERLGAFLRDSAAGDRLIHSVAPIHRAVEGQVCHIISRKARGDLATCRASAILCDESFADIIPQGVAVLITARPQLAFAAAGAILHPVAMRPAPVTSEAPGISPAAFVDPTAVLEAGVEVEPMAVVGARAEIGSGTRIGAGAVIGADVRIGRDCSIAAGASVIAAFIGNGVIVHNGVRIGQDGFGYAIGPAGMDKIAQIGRVIIQDRVEIGANTTIDRGAMDDTVIGEGTKIDNQVQVAHNVYIGRHCAIASGAGIAGSARIGNGVLIGGGSGINGHISIGDGVQIAAFSGVVGDIPAGGRYGGVPARPMPDFLREMAAKMAQSRARIKAEGDDSNG